MCAGVAIFRQNGKNLIHLADIERVFAADAGLQILREKSEHLGDAAEGYRIDQDPKRDVMMNVLMMIDIWIIRRACSQLRKRADQAIDSGLLCRCADIIARIKVF